MYQHLPFYERRRAILCMAIANDARADVARGNYSARGGWSLRRENIFTARQAVLRARRDRVEAEAR
jgi:hypothetical protein